jgi:hypothetical protein
LAILAAHNGEFDVTIQRISYDALAVAREIRAVGSG